MNKTITFISLLFLFSCGNKSSGPVSERHTEMLVQDEYFQLMNDHRVKRGLRPLILSSIIVEVSMEHSTYMSEGYGRFGHSGMSKRCERIQNELNGNRCGEIVAQGQKTAQDVLKSWLSSPGHRGRIEDPAYTHSGVAFVITSSGRTYWTQMFLDN